jgi:hypothetical protein
LVSRQSPTAPHVRRGWLEAVAECGFAPETTVDAGRPTYTAQTFGPERYELWPMQSDWHNVPEIRGTSQPPGREFTARSVDADIDDGHAQLVLDLAGAYPREDVRRWERTACLDRSTDRVTITVTDEWELDPADDARPTVVHLLLAGDVRLGAGSAAITALGGAGALVLGWHPETAAVTAEVRTLDDPMLSEVWGDRLTRLTIDVGNAPYGVLTVTMEEDER